MAETTVTGSLKMGYQLVAADLNRDGRPDLIVVDERGTELAWTRSRSRRHYRRGLQDRGFQR
jgi:hypothetical protein